ncbi:hypothetical protein RB653_010332 [Dictyostelium firmibasis]|uniref:SCP domain-containing protein n=1 Tax=Dictyostelium firmibasis TaxID=79012 RepID=A0AAN7YPP5_9MYCE
MTSSNDIIILDEDDNCEEQRIDNGLTKSMNNNSNDIRKKVNKTIVNKNGKRETLANIHSNRMNQIDSNKESNLYYSDIDTNKNPINRNKTTTSHSSTRNHKNDIICLDDDGDDDDDEDKYEDEDEYNVDKKIGSSKITKQTKSQSPFNHSNSSKNPNTKSQFLADIHEKRLNIGDSGITIDENYHKISNEDNETHQLNRNNHNNNNKSNQIKTNDEPFNYQQSLNLRKQLYSIRNEKHKNYRNDKLTKKKFFDLNDIDTLQKQELQNRMISASMETTIPTVNRNKIHTIDNTILHPEAIGRKALEFSNIFRRTQNKPPLVWNQAIYHIGVEHSKNMAEKKVAFGHDGFNERAKRYPFKPRGAGENVAYTNDQEDIANKIVNGWIDSPGHRKNLLGNFNVCSIGVYKNSEGFWYLTQLFGLQ